MMQKEKAALNARLERVKAMKPSKSKDRALKKVEEELEDDLNFPIARLHDVYLSALFTDQRHSVLYTAMICSAREEQVQQQFDELDVQVMVPLPEPWCDWIEEMQKTMTKEKLDTPDYALDHDTTAGRKLERGAEHFYTSATRLARESTFVHDTYRDSAKDGSVRLEKAGKSYRERDIVDEKRYRLFLALCRFIDKKPPTNYDDTSSCSSTEPSTPSPPPAPKRHRKRKAEAMDERDGSDTDRELLELTKPAPKRRKTHDDDEEDLEMPTAAPVIPRNSIFGGDESSDDSDEQTVEPTVPAEMDLVDDDDDDDKLPFSDDEESEDVVLEGSDHELPFSDDEDDEEDDSLLLQRSSIIQSVEEPQSGNDDEEDVDMMCESSGDEDVESDDAYTAVELEELKMKSAARVVKIEECVFRNALRARASRKNEPDAFYAELIPDPDHRKVVSYYAHADDGPDPGQRDHGTHVILYMFCRSGFFH